MGVCRRPAILSRRTSHPTLAAKACLVAFKVIIVLFLSLSSLSQAAPSASDEKTANELASLQEANRLLEEEIKLAARAQIYLLLDLSERILYIKGRGLELHRLAVLHWQVSGGGSPSGLFRLRARPQVDRPKAGPGKDPSLAPDPINLQDMPAEYLLLYEPGLLLTVAPPFREQPWLWARSFLHEWWARVASWTHVAAPVNQVPAGPRLRLTLSKEEARSLAWTVTDGMPLLIGRTAQP